MMDNHNVHHHKNGTPSSSAVIMAAQAAKKQQPRTSSRDLTVLPMVLRLIAVLCMVCVYFVVVSHINVLMGIDDISTTINSSSSSLTSLLSSYEDIPAPPLATPATTPTTTSVNVNTITTATTTTTTAAATEQEHEYGYGCSNLVQRRSNQLVCNVMHQLWRSFPPPTDPSTQAVHRALPNLIQRSNTAATTNATFTKSSRDGESIVLATHLGVQKLSQLEIQVRWWGGPVSASIYVKSQEDINKFMQFIELQSSSTFEQTSFHIVLEKTNLPYPHNILRNLAMDYLDGDYAVAADVDFIPSPESHQNLVLLFQRNRLVPQTLRSKTVMVLAAFERKMDNDKSQNVSDAVTVTEDMLPRNKQQVLDMMQRKQVNGFHMAGSSAGHGPTDYTAWKKTNQTDDFYPIVYKNIFEPYVLCYKKGMPRYWDTFRGFGYNKFSWFFEIDKAGYNFAVLRDFFVVHMNHPRSSMTNKNEMTERNRVHWRAFREYLSNQYAAPRTPAAAAAVKKNNKKDKKVVVQQ